MTSRVERLEALIVGAIEALGCRLWGIEMAGSTQNPLVRIYIDKEAGITIEDCEKVSRQVSGILDVDDPINGAYTLEVSSPGVDRLLFHPEHYAECLGELVDINTLAPIEGQRHFVGVLSAIEDDEVTVTMDEARVAQATGGKKNRKTRRSAAREEQEVAAVQIDLVNIAKARIVPEF